MTAFFAETAWLPGGWARDVRLEVDGGGTLTAVTPGGDPAGAERLRGPVIPGMPNLHSHAFQRAMAGLTERAGGGDSFWTWRSVMYGFLDRLGPEELEAVATQLYIEMLKAGYTAVAEFHYVHHDPAGAAYADPAELSLRVVAAARRAGIRLTHLPVLYAHSGFGGADPTPGQRRFINGVDGLMRIWDRVAAAGAGDPRLRFGLAPHSLRAVTPEELADAVAALDARDPTAPVHIHIAEQVKEVEDCVAWSGRRPVEWLLDHANLSARWCLVHATHLTDSETRRLAASGAIAGLCPTTEANLGDGIFPAVDYLAAGGRFGVGSDSHVSVSPVEELRLLEYGQRLVHRSRAALGDPAAPSVGERLWRLAADGGAAALGIRAGRLEAGCRADLVVLDPDSPVLGGRPADRMLDSLVFAGNVPAVRDVTVGGAWVVRDGRHAAEEAGLAACTAAVRRLTA
ncbi:formimidoylglutamate deiminase [Azospirillum sp. RWY-5-1]|uniref:Formimidoylglutamate deiminase n=1 Tax=Azospirillum oleiclasticum TaxID=2735135 RepID=A0ABX2T2A7_9PROT|nr:formimidoylglutamate deiminase [Azospirillum oleiclasticum]NYZ11227.1 formimidoylglutamate deiminase [Azospirillum oleiclasticum]NYZ18388.1 formimidoylglutamate deiminase [Azospirillum oleiclasticum]